MFPQLLLNGLIAGSIYALVALGFALIYKTVRFFHFAHGVVYTAGAYIAWTIVNGLMGSGAGWFLGIVAGIAGAAIIGILIDRVVYLPLRSRKAPDMVFLIASFGVFIFLQNLFQLIYGAQILTMRTGPVKEGRQLWQSGPVITNTQILIMVVSMASLAGLWVFVRKTRFGRAIRAVAEDPVGASVSGICSEKVILGSFGIGSAMAGLAGMLISLETNIEPTMGMNAILKGIIASIIGGIGSIPGAVLGGLFLGITENIGIWKIQAGWKDTIAFAVLILFLLLRPEGILGSKMEKERL